MVKGSNPEPAKFFKSISLLKFNGSNNPASICVFYVKDEIFGAKHSLLSLASVLIWYQCYETIVTKL